MATEWQSLFEHIGLAKLSQKSQIEISEQLGQVALDRLAARLDTILSDEQAAQVEAAFKQSEGDGIALLEQLVPDFHDIVAEEMASVVQETASMHDTIMQRLSRPKDPTE